MPQLYFVGTNEIKAVLGYSVKQKKKYSQLRTKWQAKPFTAEQEGPRKTERSSTDEKYALSQGSTHTV